MTLARIGRSDLPPPPLMLFRAKFALRDFPRSKKIEKHGMLLTKEGRCLCDRVGDSLVDRRGSKPHVRQPALFFFFGINLVPVTKTKLVRKDAVKLEWMEGKTRCICDTSSLCNFFHPSVCHVAHESPAVFQGCSHGA